MPQVENLNKLADRIYQEGIEKANKESEHILSEAKRQASEILENAKNEAERLIQDAQKSSVSFEERTSNEIRVKSNQAISDLQEYIKNSILRKTLEGSIEKAFEDESFIKELIIEATKNWSKTDQIDVIISGEIEQQVASFINSKLKEELPDLLITAGNANASGFVVKHQKEGYFIEFSSETFKAFLMPYFSRVTNDLLFNAEK